MNASVVMSGTAVLRSVADVDTQLRRRGNREMRRIWRRVTRRPRIAERLDEERLCTLRHRHMAPLFGFPVMGSLLSLGLGAVAAWRLARWGYPGILSGGWGRVLLAALTVNFGIVAVYAATLFQRYLVYPLGRLEAVDLAGMLRRWDYRVWLATRSGVRAVRERLAASGIEPAWDDPDYTRIYRKEEGEWKVHAPVPPAERIARVLRDFLGHQDPATRVHQPGRFSPYLVDGKRSITAFVKAHGTILTALRAGTLDAPDGLRALGGLRPLVRPGTEGASWLAGEIDALNKQTDAVLPAQGVKATVWRRDPWVDLTGQDEFYSSASLRGCSWMGAGSKGRIGTFGYLRNPALSCLDFETRMGRIVRARLCACRVERAGHADVPVLFVDGVEGSRVVDPAVIDLAIREYAKACGFHAVAYNTLVHNQVPKRFVRHVARGGSQDRTLRLEMIGAAEREYLDAFGVPIEPFEYAIPRGRVFVRWVPVRTGIPDVGTPIHAGWRAWLWLRRNLLFILVGQATALLGALMLRTTPELLGPMLLFIGIAVVVNQAYQFRGFRRKHA